ncbi:MULTISPECIES: PTS lactose/cellobiose transporter subunit IIA [Streptococcus]|uniref:PTS lactose/cellobiose transporter subunit IIA n=1 Tax=Streptococcus zalophi TaxID=640031 RepID=A0A934P8R5_9STRE|nr:MULTISPECIES: PTS lactose/cellobiose transporter subunit IIA [Streptococcus]MBJ8349071.1 PTS lactose/cellobiose transporter subunit IIA [Streptococcus zalophi]MCR8967778.1 PTS lactose/cellobiose transporter subunit IIA [Streptococcus zalophi]MCU9533639.1 PTS lactose/cellobiose transporter subunit IIA [Streptococcus sp. CSL10205-OR2]
MAEPANLEAVMGLIMHGGDAKGKAVEAIREAKVGHFTEAHDLIKQANEALNIAHKSQTELLTQEASGDTVELSLLLIHGQDHLMTALTFIDMAKEVIALYEKIDSSH